MPRLAWLLAAALATGHAQPPPARTVENTGKPMLVPFTCDENDVQTLGLVCSEEDPCPVYVELNAVESAGAHLFVTGDIHTPTATLGSLLLASSDGAKTWTEPHPRIHYSSLDQIEFVDFANGWISGALIQTLPRDPFFLETSDGGKTWHQRELFEDTHPGSIDSFWFETPKTGTILLTVDGGKLAMYRTIDGGDNWELSQVLSTAAPIPHARVGGDPAWRLRTNSKAHSYEVETREGNEWKRVASFLVEIGTCK